METTQAEAIRKLRKDNEQQVQNKNNGKGKKQKYIWLTDHSSVGTQVSAPFSIEKNKKKILQYFGGKITKYCIESIAGANDQLYHVVWEDGDEEDYDQSQYDLGCENYLNIYSKNNSNK